jgi:hypothetical protein
LPCGTRPPRAFATAETPPAIALPPAVATFASRYAVKWRNVTCRVCGRWSHSEEDCYARTHLNGTPL